MKKIISIISVILVVLMLGVVLFACIPTNPDKAKANLDKAGYTTYVNTDGGEIEIDGTKYPYTATLNATKDGETISIVWFKKAAGAKAYAKSDEAKDLKDMYSNVSGKEIEMKNSSKAFYIGTKQAVKDVK